MLIKEIYDLIQSVNTIYVASHINPDGDNVGSLMGMYLALKNLDKDVKAVIIDEIPDNLKFLPRLNEAVTDEFLDIPDLFISVDCADIERLGRLSEIYKKTPHTINIDHHSTNTNFGELNYVDSTSPATCEMVYYFLKNSNIEIDTEIATCLYSGISTDTGSFKYDSVKKSTFDAAGDLLSKGIDINSIGVNLYHKRSREKTDLLIKALSNLEYYFEGRVAIVHLNEDLIKSCNAKKTDSEGIVEFIRDIDEVEVAVFLKEKSDEIKLSVRTKEYVDAIKIVSPFGGGGHIRAAGATLKLPLRDRIDDVLNIINGELNGWNINI